MTAPREGTTSPPLARLTRISALLAAVTALAGLVTWMAGSWSRLTFGSEYVPMAPVTAILLLLHALALWIAPSSEDPRSRRPLATLLIGIVLASGVTALVANALGVDNPLERWLAVAPMRGGVPVGRLSVYTAGLLTLLSGGRLLHGATSVRARVSVVCTLLTLTASAFIVQAYLLGSPLLYGTNTIPVAALTSVALLSLSASSLMWHGSDAWPLRVMLDTSRSGPPSVRGFRALAAVLSLFVVVSGALWYRGARDRADAQAQEELRAAAEGLAARIGDWHATQLLDAHAVTHLAPWGEDPLDVEDAARWMRALMVAFEYQSVALYTGSGDLLEVQPMEARPSALRARARIPALGVDPDDGLARDGVREDDGARTFGLWVPIRRSADSAPAGWLLLRKDARTTLDRLVRSLPSRATSAEAIIYAVEGESAIPLHDLRKLPEAALSLRIPIRTSPTVVALGLRDGFGVYRAVDYAGTPVTAAALPIAGTSWVLVAKVDRTELAIPLRRLAVRASLLSLLLVLALAAFVYALWYRRDLASANRELVLLQQRDASLEELARSEARYARALNATSDGVWEWHARSDEYYLSPKWKQAFGADQEHLLLERDFIERVHPTDRSTVRAAFESHLASGTPLDIEFRWREDSGRYRWVWSRGEAERDAEGRAVRMTGSIADITERREATLAFQRLDRILRLRSAANQALVRASSEEQLLQSVCDIAVREGGYRMAWVGYAQHDPARTVRPMAWSGNESGYLQENLITWSEEPRGLGPTGRSIRSGRPQPAQDIASDAALAPWRTAAALRGFASSCAIPLTSDASPMGALTLYSAEPFAFDADEVALLSELGNDLSFGIKALRDHHAVAAQQSELRLFREVMQHSTDAIFLLDATTSRFIDFNEAACRELGYTPEEMRTLGPADIVPRLDSPAAVRQMGAEIAETQTPIRISEHRRKDGTTFPVEVSRTMLEVGGRHLILAIARDLTERTKAETDRSTLEQQLLRSQRMESVGRLAGGVAHDFNNLLTVINANADIVAAELPAGSPIAADVLQIRAAGARAAALTRQLLAFSRQSVMRREVIDLTALATTFLGLLRRVIGEDVRLETKFSERSCPVFADPGQLEQVLMNLCVNARDAMPRGGTLTLETTRVDVDEAFAATHETMRPGPHVLVRISDTGMGMTPDVQAHIFEPFFTTKEPGKGTGLGLATVYGIVKQTGGSIWVDSAQGRGTTFRIYLPLHESEAAPVATPAPVAPATGHETILVVEDDPTIRQVARRILEKGGYTVHTAGNASEGLDFLELHHQKVHLLLTDLVMPGMSGIELAREVRLRFPAIIVLLTSGYSAEALAAQVENEPSLPIISKPYAVTDLLAMVRTLLDRTA